MCIRDSYRTQDNVIDGVVITFIDITEVKQLEAQLGKSGELSLIHI